MFFYYTGRKVQHKGRGKRYLTEEEIRIAEEKKRREKGWKVSFISLPYHVTNWMFILQKLKKGLGEDSDEEESEEGEEGAVASKSKPVASKGLPGELPPTDSSEEEEDSEEEERQVWPSSKALWSTGVTTGFSMDTA